LENTKAHSTALMHEAKCGLNGVQDRPEREPGRCANAHRNLFVRWWFSSSPNGSMNTGH